MGNKQKKSMDSKQENPVQEDIDSTIQYTYEDVSQTPIKISQNDDQTKPLLSVMITISSCSEQDLFQRVQPFSTRGRISFYLMSLKFVSVFYEVWNEKRKFENEIVQNMIKEMNEVSPNAVVFNFESCEGLYCHSPFIDAAFHFPLLSSISLINSAIEKGYMVVCSNYAVRALFNGWNEKLGPNPFINLGMCEGITELCFEKQTLQDSPSKQLQMVGQLSESGIVTLQVPSPTIILGLKGEIINNKIYQLAVYSIVTKTNVIADEKINYSYCIGDKCGTIGHAALKYNTGGILLICCGDWSQIYNFDIKIEDLENACKNQYEEENAAMNQMENIKNIQDSKTKKEKIEYLAKRFIQQTVPCNYSSKI